MTVASRHGDSDLVATLHGQTHRVEGKISDGRLMGAVVERRWIPGGKSRRNFPKRDSCGQGGFEVVDLACRLSPYSHVRA